jgi:hypothetical protein
MKTCGRCGAENPDEKSACLTCFAPLDAGAEGTLELGATGRGLRLPWTTLFYLLLVVAAAGLIYFFLGGGSAASVTRRYLELVQMDRKEAAGQFVAGGVAGNLLPHKGLRIDEFEIMPGVAGTGSATEVPVQLALAVSVSASTLSPDRASMFVDLFKALKKPVAFNMVMKKEGRRWKVDEAESRSQLDKAIESVLTTDLKEKLEIVSKAAPSATGAAASARPTPGAAAPSAPVGAPAGPVAVPGPGGAPAMPGAGGPPASGGGEYM